MQQRSIDPCLLLSMPDKLHLTFSLHNMAFFRIGNHKNVGIVIGQIEEFNEILNKHF